MKMGLHGNQITKELKQMIPYRMITAEDWTNVDMQWLHHEDVDHFIGFVLVWLNIMIACEQGEGRWRPKTHLTME